MRDKKLIVAAIVAAIAVACLGWALWPARSPLGRKAGAVESICAACGKVETRHLAAVPDVCGACGQRQVYPAAKCPHCGAPNPLPVAMGPQMRTNTLTCRSCGKVFSPLREP